MPPIVDDTGSGKITVLLRMMDLARRAMLVSDQSHSALEYFTNYDLENPAKMIRVLATAHSRHSYSQRHGGSD